MCIFRQYPQLVTSKPTLKSLNVHHIHIKIETASYTYLPNIKLKRVFLFSSAFSELSGVSVFLGRGLAFGISGMNAASSLSIGVLPDVAIFVRGTVARNAMLRILPTSGSATPLPGGVVSR